MRRIVMAVIGMCVGSTLLVGLKAHGAPGGPEISTGAPEDPGTGGPSGDPAGIDATSGSSPQPGSTTASGQPTSGQPTTKAPTGAATTTAAPATKSYTGAAIAVKTAQSPTTKASSCGDCHNYTMSVTITVANGKITSARVAYNTSPGASQSYASKAATTLSRSILSSQTWNLGRVSGATYSGNAFELSAKDAMGRAGLM